MQTVSKKISRVNNLLELINAHFERVKLYEAEQLHVMAESSQQEACRLMFWHDKCDVPAVENGQRRFTYDELLPAAFDQSNRAVTTTGALRYKLSLIVAELNQAEWYINNLKALIDFDRSLGANRATLNQRLESLRELRTLCVSMERSTGDLVSRARATNHRILKAYDQYALQFTSVLRGG